MDMDSKEFTPATIVDVFTPTLLRVQLSDGRVLLAALCPELRHLSLRANKQSLFSVGMNLEIELSPFSDDKCRVIRIIEDVD